MKPYRCQNKRCSTDPHGRLIYDFWCEPPGKCPKCGLVEGDPRSRGLVIALVVVHFNPPHPAIDDLGTGFVACSPDVRVGTGNVRATGDPTVVTCPDCKKTPEFIAALDTWGWTLVAASDYEVVIDPVAGTIAKRTASKAVPKAVPPAAAPVEEGCCG